MGFEIHVQEYGIYEGGDGDPLSMILYLYGYTIRKSNSPYVSNYLSEKAAITILAKKLKDSKL
jgi:hypothetical protein